ncbi:MAG TPA: hypothetical protein VGD67_00365, partial [Pseudonocardiaceae bacterium]
PLAAHPGPLPFDRPPRGRSGAATLAVGLVALLVFGVGAAGGFGLSRWAAGVPLVPDLRTVPGLDPRVREEPAVPELRTAQVTVTNQLLPTDPEVVGRFTIGVPAGWAEYRPPLGGDEKLPVLALFVAPEGNRTISVDRATGVYPGGGITDHLDAMYDRLGDQVDEPVVRQPANPVGPVPPGATEAPHETSFRTVERGGDVELRRTILVHLLPTASDLWIVSVTVPSDQQKAADALFRQVVSSFVPG